MDPCLQLTCGHSRIRQGNLKSRMVTIITPARRSKSSAHISPDLMICGKVDLITTTYLGFGRLRDRGHMSMGGISSHHGPLFVVSPDVFPLRLPNVQTDVQMGGCLFGLFSANKT